MKRDVSIIIVTKNRSKDLKECLHSLLTQSVKPDNIIVINNNSTDKTHDVITRFAQKLPIREYIEYKSGYSEVYNRGLTVAKSTWVAFIDDDCIADRNWYKNLLQAIKNNPKAQVIRGVSLNAYPKNIFACCFQFSNSWWLEQTSIDTSIIDYRNLDSRNILYNRAFLKSRHIEFDNSLVYGSEDSDLGLQIRKNHGVAILNRDLCIYHKEPITFYRYFKKKQQYLRSTALLELKWKKQFKGEISNSEISVLDIFNDATNSLPLLSKILASSIILSDILITKCFTFYNKFAHNRMISLLIKRTPYISVNLSISALLLFISMCFGLLVSEKYFFDKLLYRKSEIYGYTANEGLECCIDNSDIINQRVKDIKSLIQASEKNINLSNTQKNRPNSYRVVIIGDSYAYGLGIRIGQRFSDVLNKKLNSLYKTELYLLADSGDSILDNYAKFVLAKKYYNADLYIITMVDNDLLFDWIDKYPGEKDIFDSFKKDCPGPIKRSQETNNTLNDWETENIIPSFSERFANICILRKIANSLLISGSNVFFYNVQNLPCSGNAEGTDYEKQCYALNAYTDNLIREGLIVKDTSNVNFKYSNISSSEGHPSAKTHEQFADSLFKWITKTPNFHFNSAKNTN